MAHNHPHHKHGHEKQHEKPTDRLRQGPIGMVKERSNIATFLAFSLVGFVILLVLAVIAYLIFN